MNKEVNYDVLMNNYVLEFIYNVTNGALEHLETAMLLCLTGHGAVNQEKSFGYAELADFCGCSRRSIIKAIDRLQAKINQPDTGLTLTIEKSEGAKNTYCISTYIRKCDEDKKDDENPPHTTFTLMSHYAYNQLTADIRNKIIAPKSVRLLCLVWRQVFGYRNKNGIPHKERNMSKDYIKSISGIKYDHDIYRAQNELRDLGYFIHLCATSVYVNGTKTTRTKYEPRTININSYRTAKDAPAFTGHPKKKATGVQRTPLHQRSEDTPIGVYKTPTTIYTKDDNNKDCFYNKDGLTTASLSKKMEISVKNSVSSSDIGGNPVSEVGFSTAISEADTVTISEKEEDKTTRLAIARYELQQKMAAMGMYAEIVELPPIEGLPDEYVAEYAKFRMDVIIKNSEDYIDKHTNPIMAPSISQFSAFS